MDKIKKNIIISTGNLGIGGQEKMLTEFLKLFSPDRYNLLLLIEEDKGDNNHYIGEIPSDVQSKFLTTWKFMEKLEKSRDGKDPLSKLLYSYLLKKKKAIALREMKKYLNFADVIIDYNMGLLRYLHKLNLKDKRVIGWSHAGEGSLERKKQKRLNMGLYHTIVVLNDEMKKGFERNYAHEKFRVEKIYNFLEENIIRERSKIFKVKEGSPYIITVGSLTENKNQKLLLQAFSKVAEVISDINLLVIGEGPLRKNLENDAKKLKIEEKVKFLGLQQNPYPYIKNSEFLVQSSIQEGFGLVLIEGMILGKAVISTKNNGSIEITENGKYGVLSKHNPQDLGEKMLDLLQNKEKLRRFEKLSKERSGDFSEEIARGSIEKIIDREV